MYPNRPALRSFGTIVLFLCLLLPTANGQDDAAELYSINADRVQVDDSSGTVTYAGNAKVIVSNVVIEADSISIVKQNGLPLRIEAHGNPIRFQEKVPRNNINGIAKEVTFSVAELKLTLVDYSITDPAGNNMKGKKASFILAP